MFMAAHLHAISGVMTRLLSYLQIVAMHVCRSILEDQLVMAKISCLLVMANGS